VAESLLVQLLETSLRGTAAVGLVAAVLLLARVRDSRVRYGAWIAAVLAMLAMPVLTAIAPDVPVPLPSFASLPAGSASVFLPSSREHGSATDARLSGDERARTSSDDDPAVVPPVTLRRAADSTPAVTWGWLSFVIAALYLSGVTVFVLRLAFGYRQLARLARSSRPIPTADARAQVDSGDPVFESPVVSTPVTMGILRPRVVLPSDWRSCISG
jgi:beta-lactamase regulating signal transducer with metallopeptidase domain